MRRCPATIERIGARFARPEVARKALGEVRGRFGLGVADAEVYALRARGGVIVERRGEPDPAVRVSTSRR